MTSKKTKSHFNGRTVFVILCALFSIVALMVGGCSLLRDLIHSDKDEIDNIRVVSAPVDWRNIPAKARFDGSRFSMGGLTLSEGLEFYSVFPAQDSSHAWDFTKLKMQFRGSGSCNGAVVRATIEAVVEMAVVPAQHLRLQVSQVGKVTISLFDASGKKIAVDMAEAGTAFSERIAKLVIDLDGHIGVVEKDLPDGKVWCHNDHIEFNVRK